VKIDRLTILWPSGLDQTLTDLQADQHILVFEGTPTPRRITPGKAFLP
jgi:hypothetical protein